MKLVFYLKYTVQRIKQIATVRTKYKIKMKYLIKRWVSYILQE